MYKFRIAREHGHRCSLMFAEAIEKAQQALQTGVNSREGLKIEYEQLKEDYIATYDSDHIGYHLHGGGAMRDLDLMQHGDRSFVNGKDLTRFIRDFSLCPCMRIFNGNTCNASSCPRNLRVFHDMELVIRRSKQSARPIGLSISMPWPQHLAQYRTGGRFAPPPGKGRFTVLLNLGHYNSLR